MSDLISRSEVIDLLYKTFDEYRISTDKTSTLGGFGSEVFKRVREMPTAYDVDEVVEESEMLKEQFLDVHNHTHNPYGKGMVCGAERIIEIVKQGCVTNDVCEKKIKAVE